MPKRPRRKGRRDTLAEKSQVGRHDDQRQPSQSPEVGRQDEGAPHGGVQTGANQSGPGRRPAVWKLFLAWLGLSAAVWLFFYVGLFSIVGADWLRSQFFDFVMSRQAVPFERVHLVWLDEAIFGGDQTNSVKTSVRGPFAELVSGLARSGAAVVAFDIHFRRSAPEDEALADAIRAAEARDPPLRVVVAATRSGADRVTGSPVLRQVLGSSPHWGLIDIPAANAIGDFSRRRYGLALEERIHPRLKRIDLTPSLALQAYLQYRFPGADCGVRRSPGAVRATCGEETTWLARVDRNLQMVLGVPDLLTFERSSHDFAKLMEAIDEGRTPKELRGSVVVAGLRSSVDRLSLSRAEVGGRSGICGYEIQAAAVWNLLREAFLSPLSEAWQGVVILVMTLLGMAVGMRSGRTIPLSKVLGRIPVLPSLITEAHVPILLLLVGILYLVILFVAARSLGVVSDFLYDLAALGLCCAVMRKWTGRGSRSEARAPASEKPGAVGE